MEPTAPFDLTLAIDGWLNQLQAKKRWTASRWAAYRWTAYRWGAHRFRADDLEELRSHLLDQTDDFIASGQSPEQAFRLAIRQLGEPDYLAREYRKVTFWYEVRQKARSMGEVVVTSRKVVAFSMVFVAITFGSIFGQKPSHQRASGDTVKSFPKADTIQKGLPDQSLLCK